MQGSRGILLIIALIAIVAVWLYFNVFGARIANHDPQGEALVVMGDELTNAPGVPSELRWIGILEKRYGVTFVNTAQNGDTTDMALGRFNSGVLDLGPRVVIIMLGANDLAQGISLERSVENLKSMIGQLQNKGTAVVLVGVSRQHDGDKLPVAQAKLARELKCAYVDDAMAGIPTDMTLMLANAPIPNSKGQALIADRIGRVLEKKLSTVFKKK